MLLESILKKIFGDPNAKELKNIQVIVDKINALEPEMQALSSANLAAKTGKFKLRLAKGETLDDILPEAFAVVRETSRRITGMRHFDVQLIGGVVLHRGKIAEMRTGEGKTLVATLPAYLNALTGKGVHVVTVNDYLARRDSEDMGRIYRALGLSVGLIVHDMDYPDRKAAYAADITYGTNNEFGFDYLRDNMVVDENQMVQRELNFCIVDEVDSILIDEARTPLIISGPGEKSTDLYRVLAHVVANMNENEDYTVDEKLKTVAPTETGIAKAEKMLGIVNLYDAEHGVDFSHHLMCALKAKAIMHRDRDYVVKDGQVIIVDEFTGRLMFGRRFSEGLHQAIEAKEGVKVERESQTLATITFQNYFRMYNKLSGMTGTAKTEEQEFQKIYGLDVIVIPTNKPMIRIDYPDVIYKTKRAKYKAAVAEIEECHKSGRPVLVGTTSIAQSEELSAMLKRRGIAHNVLNAKYHEKEAEIISKAGQYGAVTIATNMAGRGIACTQFPEGATDLISGAGAEFRAISDPTRLYPIAEPFGALENNPTGIFEPNMKTGSLVTSFVNTYFQNTGVPVLGLSSSKGGSVIANWQDHDDYLTDTITRLKSAQTFCEQHNITLRHQYLLWCQGESDGDHHTSADEYTKQFMQMYEKLKAVGIEHCFLIGIGAYNGTADDICYDEIRNAQYSFAEHRKDITVVSRLFEKMKARGLMKDSFHYYQAGYNEVGKDAAINTAKYVLTVA